MRSELILRDEPFSGRDLTTPVEPVANWVFRLKGRSLTGAWSPHAHCPAIGLIAIWTVLRVWHMLRVRKISAFVYDEQEPPLVTT